MNHEEIIRNRAHLDPDGRHEVCPDGTSSNGTSRRCDGVLLFAMRDRHHAFSLDLETVLSCLAMAEAEGEVPELPDAWWQLVRNRYNLG
ncbi:MAG TPA: hypothetical protein ENK43_04050 [Planctomycetes bacterium]|nr:hypothetical protein [Planctomycetota bacterium]